MHKGSLCLSVGVFPEFYFNKQYAGYPLQTSHQSSYARASQGKVYYSHRFFMRLFLSPSNLSPRPIAQTAQIQRLIRIHAVLNKFVNSVGVLINIPGTLLPPPHPLTIPVTLVSQVPSETESAIALTAIHTTIQYTVNG